jgi:DNA gyrase subunit A
MGVINIKVTDKNGKVAGIAHVVDDDQLLLITEQGMIIRTRVRDLRSMGRSTQGVKVINVEENDRVVAAVKLVEKEQGDETAGEPTPLPTESVH